MNRKEENVFSLDSKKSLSQAPRVVLVLKDLSHPMYLESGSCIMQCLIPTKPVIPIGVSRHFRAAAFVHSVTSPNKHRTNLRSKNKKKVSGFLFQLTNNMIPVNFLFYTATSALIAGCGS